MLALAGNNVLTVEQSEEFIAIARSLIPKELQATIEFSHRPAEVVQCFAPYQYCLNFPDIPSIPYDLVVIDGPDGWEEPNGKIDLPNGNIVELLDTIKIGAKIYLDGRKTSSWLYRKYLLERMPLVEHGKNYGIFEKIALKK